MRTSCQTTSWLLLLAMGALICPAAHGAFVYENSTEFTASGDFDGDGSLDVVIVDRSSGTYRIGYQLSPGTFTWAAPRASGIESVSGFTVGRIASTSMDALAFTAPDANRLNVFTANNPTLAGLPVSLFSPGVGPSLAVAIDVGGANNTALDDFVIGSTLNSGSPIMIEALRNQGTALELLGSYLLASTPRRGNLITIKAGNPAMAGMLLRNGSNDLFKAYLLTSGTPVEAVNATVGPPFNLDYAFGFFNSSSALAQFLFYKPGVTGLMVRPVQESAGTFTLAPGPVFDLGDAVRQVFTIVGPGSPRLLVIFGAGGTAGVYDFDGSNFPVPLQTFTADAGEVFTGAAALAGGNVMLFSGPPGSSSSKFRHYTVNGSAYSLHASGGLPAVSEIAHRANVMTFQFEPFVTSAPNLLQSFNAGDWSSLYLAAPGSQATVTFESFINPETGLANPVTQTLSPINSLAQFSLVNQYREPISLFRLTPAVGSEMASANILPAPGTYKTSVQIIFNTATSQSRVFFRIDSASAWTIYTAPFWIFKDTTISFYATPTLPPTPLKSVIRNATYHITQPPQTLDSDGDGVPDYVEIAKGLDPVKSGADADGDGYSDLDELINGSDPANGNSVPSGQPRQDLHGAVDLIQAPQAVDGMSGQASDCTSGTVLRAFDLTGDLLSEGSAAHIPLPGLNGPAAVLSNVVVDVGMKLVAVATEPHFDIVTAQADKRIGRELIRLLDTAYFVDNVALPRSWTGGNLNTEADLWINTASNALSTVTRKQVVGNMSAYDSLAALLVEAKIHEILLARGQTGFSNLSLFPFRSGDSGRSALAPGDLAALEQQSTNRQPAFQLRRILGATETALSGAPPTDPAQQLKALAWEIYRISSASNNIPGGALAWPFYPSPVDTLRAFLQTGALHSNYLAASATLPSLAAPAFSQAQAILASLGGRPLVTLNLKVRSDTFQETCVLLDTLDGTQVRSLVNAAGAPFEFVDAFKLPVGTVLTVTGYDDVTNSLCAGAALEVLSVVLFGPPQFTSDDTDGDLLPDALELALFGNLNQNASGDFDGDGFSNLQEIFDGTDPTDPASKGRQPVNFALPAVQLQFASAGQIKLQFHWPAAYAEKVQFNLYGAANLGAQLTQLPAVQNYLGNDTFQFTLPQPGTPAFFYQIVVLLK